jgi:ankyrin repeat protein
MGCQPSKHQTVKINNCLLSLLLVGKTEDCIELIESKNIKLDNPMNVFGDTLLHYATKRNDDRMVGYLLAKDPQLKFVQNRENKTPQDLCKSKKVQKLYNIKRIYSSSDEIE